ncbi:MAG TPA: hypothetical protein VLA12_00405 [Planctomycetaceae bacterium]|nr:hypothetical protein [Planctomycetaceae bacterium]
MTVLSIGIFKSELINSPISRMCLIVLVSFSLTTFGWAMYPHAVRTSSLAIPFLGWKVSGFAGPLLLFFVSLGALHLFFPDPAPPDLPATRYYSLLDPGNPTPADTFLFDGKASHPRLLAVKDPNRPRDGLIGFVARFDSPEPFTVKLSNQFNLFEEQTIELEPGTTNGSISLTLNSPD